MAVWVSAMVDVVGHQMSGWLSWATREGAGLGGC